MMNMIYYMRTMMRQTRMTMMKMKMWKRIIKRRRDITKSRFTESRVHSYVQQRELLDQGGLGASSEGHLDVLSLGLQGWVQKTWARRLDLDERRGHSHRPEVGQAVLL